MSKEPKLRPGRLSLAEHQEAANRHIESQMEPSRVPVRPERVMLRALVTASCLALLFAVPVARAAQPHVASVAGPKGDNGASFTREPTDLTHIYVRWSGTRLTVKLDLQQDRRRMHSASS